MLLAVSDTKLIKTCPELLIKDDNRDMVAKIVFGDDTGNFRTSDHCNSSATRVDRARSFPNHMGVLDQIYRL